MKKIYLIFIFLLFPITLNAVSSDDVDYTVEGIYINGEIEIAGSVHFREVIKVSGTYNGYIRDIVYANSKLDEFTGKKEDFKGSSIYNGTGLNINKVGIFKKDKFYQNKFYVPYSEDYTKYVEESVDFYDEESEGKYEISDITNGKSIKLYNETEDGTTYFYIDYLVQNVLVEHNDCAEFYYNIIGDGFDDDIKEVNATIWLPYPDEENLKVWAHGPLNGEGIRIEGGYGAQLKIQNLYANTPIDLRMIYRKDYFMININESKKSGIDALPLILEVEQDRANEANEQRKIAKAMYYVVIGADIIYLLGLIYFTIYVYRKHDKEFPSNFKHKYNREFIDDYNVEIIPYLMKGYVNEDAFSASILNLIYKKAISVEKLKTKKNIYIFKKLNDNNLTSAENKIMKLLFDEIGSNNEVSTEDIKKASRKSSSNDIYNAYNSWKTLVNTDAHNQEFFINNFKTKLIFILYGVGGLILSFISASIGMQFYYILPLIVLSLAFIIYIGIFRKRTIKGNDHYKKWKAFENFLNDFGRFEEKDLPEVVLWERYLVYATVFGIAAKVSKEMKVKFDQMKMNDTSLNDSLFNYYLFNNIGNDITREINTAVTRSISTVQAANSSMSSGSGFGGGFSSGGGFGGGGGGGRGF